MKILHEGKAIIIGDEKLDLSLFPDLKVIGCPMTGLDHLPVEEIESRGIKLISLRDFPLFLKSITSTSEHTFGLIIALLRNYKTALREPYQDRETYKGHTLAGKTLGIIGGNGRIGSQMAKIGEAFGMNILINDKKPCLPWRFKRKCFIEVSPEELLRKSDIVSVHIHLDDNEGFFTEAMFGFMKSSALFINTSRNKVIQEGALLEALQNNIIAGAAMDFIDDDALRDYASTHDNLLLTNHIGGVTFEDRERTEQQIEIAVENFISNNK